MTGMAINGIGAVGGFGCGVDALMDALATSRECHGNREVRTDSGTVDLPICESDPSPLGEFFSSRTLRRVNRFGKMVCLAASMALKDAGGEETIDGARLGLILATGYGSTATTFDLLDSYHEDDNSNVSPLTFSYSVHASALSTATILLGITGPALTVNQLEASTGLALATAHQWLDDGRVDAVLVGGCDEYCDVLGYTYATLFPETTLGGLDVGNLDAQAAVPGEGAGFLLVSQSPSADAYGWVHPPRFGADSRPADADLRFLGFDGHPRCGQLYRPFVSDAVPAVTLANLTGSFPARPMVDVVAAAAALKQPFRCSDDCRMNDVAIPESLSMVDVVVADENRGPYSIRVTSIPQSETDPQ